MKQITIILIALCAVLLMPSCTENKFETSGTLDDAPTTNLQFSYCAQSSKQTLALSVMAPVVDGRFEMLGTTHYPTVVYVSNQAGTELTWFWAERGDKITIAGAYDSPEEWVIEGNDLNRDLTRWRKEHLNLLKSHDAKSLNKAVAEQVKANPKDKLSYLLLINYYNPSEGADYQKLYDMLDSGLTSGRMATACGLDPETASRRGIDDRLPVSFQIYSDGDTLTSYSVAKGNTLFIIANGDEQAYRHSLQQLARSPRKGMRTVSISLAQDTMTWHRRMRADTAINVTHVWAYGSPLPAALRPENMATTPWFVMADRKGNIKHSGSDLPK